eukprot:TCONS_00035698-protein
MRKLKRILFSLGLARRKPNCSLAHVCDTLMTEIQGSGSLLGYRCMHQKLRVIHNIQISRNNVMNLQKAIDPIGVAERRARKLKRRRYITPGPNYLWHLDGYDKLKRYGICIHGCIDGYSRKLIWLEAASTNNCPAVVAGFFLNQVKSLKGTALNVRADRGTENSNIAGIQRLFRSNDNDFQAIEKSFRFGRSTSNQRIEAFWSQLKRSLTQWWMNFFKDMIDDGTFDESDEIQRECLKFCFLQLIQKELDDFKLIHNTHRRSNETTGGKPELLYSMPNYFGATDFMWNVREAEINVAEAYCRTPNVFGCG